MPITPENDIYHSNKHLLGEISDFYSHQGTLTPDTNTEAVDAILQLITSYVSQKHKILMVIAYPDKPPEQSVVTTEETINNSIVFVVKKHFLRKIDGQIVSIDQNGDSHTMGDIINNAYTDNRTVFFELIDKHVLPSHLTEFARPKKQIVHPEAQVKEKKPSTTRLSSKMQYHGQLLKDIPYEIRRQIYIDNGVTIENWVLIELVIRDVPYKKITEITGFKKSNISLHATRIEEKLDGRASD